MTISVLGIDIGKNNFHLFGVDEKGRKVIRKKLSRKNLLEYVANLEPCIIAMEACGGAHYLARLFMSYGHTVKLISPQFVKPYVKTNKNDYNCLSPPLSGIHRLVKIAQNLHDRPLSFLQTDHMFLLIIDR